MTDKVTDRPKLLALGSDKFVKQIQNVSFDVVPIPLRQFAVLDARDIAGTSASVVVSDLFDPHLDCMEIGQKLHDAGFQGLYVILTDDLPNPAIISRELLQHYPKLTFRICTVSDLPSILTEISI